MMKKLCLNTLAHGVIAEQSIAAEHTPGDAQLLDVVLEVPGGSGKI